MSWRSRPGRCRRPPWLRLALLLGLCGSGWPGASAAESAAIVLPDPLGLPWRLVKEATFAGTQFHLAQLHGSADPELLAFGREFLDEDRSSFIEFELEPPFPPIWPRNFAKFRGGLAGGGDLEGDGREELIFWQYHAERQRLGFWVERQRRHDKGTVVSDTVLTCAEIPARHAGGDHEQLPRSHPEGRILTAEGRIVVPVTAGYNWRQTPRGLLVYDLQGALRAQIRLPNNTAGYRFADLDGDARREIFLTCYSSNNGDSCARGDDSHSYWRVLDLEGHDRLGVQAGEAATLATTQPLRPGAQALPLVLASLSRSQADLMRLFDGAGKLLREERITGALQGQPLVVDLDGDGAEEVLVGLGDGRLLRYDALLEQRARWRFAAAVQPLCATDFTGDARPELLLRVGNELLVCDRELKPLARWTEPLTERLQNPVAQVSCWQAQDGLTRLALVGLQQNRVGVLRLEPNPQPLPARVLLFVAISLLLVAAMAILWLAFDRRRLVARLSFGVWRDLAGSLTDEQRRDAEWARLYEGLYLCSPRHGSLHAHLLGLNSYAQRLRDGDSARNRENVAIGAREVRKRLPGLQAIVPLARRLLCDDPEVDKLAALTSTLERRLATLETSENPLAVLGVPDSGLTADCNQLVSLADALLKRVEPLVQRPVLDQILRLMPELKALAAAAQAPFEVALAGPLDSLRPRLSPMQFGDLIRALVKTGLTRVPGGGQVPLRLEFAVADDCLEFAARTPGGRDGPDTAALWAELVAAKPDGVAVFEQPDALCMRVRLREHAAPATRRRGAAAGLLLLAVCLAGPSAVRAAESNRPLAYRFESVRSFVFPPAAVAQFCVDDLEGDGAGNSVLLLRDERRQASWLLVERQQGHARVDSIALAGAGEWSLLGAGDLDEDGRAEILLGCFAADTLALHRLWFPSAAATVETERLLALPLGSQPAPAARRPHFTQWRRLAPGRHAFVYALPGSAQPAGILVCSLAAGLLWQREFAGPASIEDLADRDGDGRPELLIAVTAGAPGAAVAAPPGACQAIDLDDAGRTLSSETCGSPGSQLRRLLLRDADGRALGELRLLTPAPAAAQGTRVEYRPADGAASLAREPGWRAQAAAALDLDGDGSEEFVLATTGSGAGRAELIACDRALRETARLALPGSAQALLVADLSGDGPPQLLVVLPDRLLLVDRAFRTLARQAAGPRGGDDLRAVALCSGGARKPKRIALLDAGRLQLLGVGHGDEEQAGGRWESLAVFVAGGLLGAALALAWQQWQRGKQRRPWLDETAWELRARLLGRLLDLRDQVQLPQRLGALREASLRAATGDPAAARGAGEARSALRQELALLPAAWPRGIEAAGRRGLVGLLAEPLGTPSAPAWRRLAADVDRLASGLCGLERQLARALSADPVACFQAALARRLQDGEPLDELGISVPGGRVPPVVFEPAQLEIVFDCLLGNALHFMRDRPDRRLHLELEPRGGRLRLLLEDSGPGVPSGSEEEIFTPGFTTRASGHGNGLTIARRLVEAFGGRIACLPGPGRLRGARFELRLRLLDKQD